MGLHWFLLKLFYRHVCYFQGSYFYTTLILMINRIVASRACFNLISLYESKLWEPRLVNTGYCQILWFDYRSENLRYQIRIKIWRCFKDCYRKCSNKFVYLSYRKCHQNRFHKIAQKAIYTESKQSQTHKRISCYLLSQHKPGL